MILESPGIPLSVFCIRPADINAVMYACSHAHCGYYRLCHECQSCSFDSGDAAVKVAFALVRVMDMTQVTRIYPAQVTLVDLEPEVSGSA